MPRAWGITRHTRGQGLSRARGRHGSEERFSVGGAVIIIGGASAILWIILALLIEQVLE